MTASFPYLNRTYSQLPPAPQAMEAKMYTPIGGGSGSYPKSRKTTVAPAMAERPCTKMSMAGGYSIG